MGEPSEEDEFPTISAWEEELTQCLSLITKKHDVNATELLLYLCDVVTYSFIKFGYPQEAVREMCELMYSEFIAGREDDAGNG